MFFAVSIGAVLTWTVFGTALRSFIRDRRKLRIFNIAMALLLVASIVPMVLPFGGGDGLF